MPFHIVNAINRPLPIARNRFPTRKEAAQAKKHLEMGANYRGLRVKRIDPKRNGPAKRSPEAAEAVRRVTRAMGSPTMRKFLRGSPMNDADALAFWGARSFGTAAARQGELARAVEAAEALQRAGAPGLPEDIDVACWRVGNLNRLLANRHADRFASPKRNDRDGAWVPMIGERVSGYNHPRLGRSWRRGVVAVEGDAFLVEGDDVDPTPIRVPRREVFPSPRRMNGAAARVVEFEPPRRGAHYRVEEDVAARRFTLRGDGPDAVAVGTFPPGTEAERDRWLTRWGRGSFARSGT